MTEPMEDAPLQQPAATPAAGRAPERRPGPGDAGNPSVTSRWLEMRDGIRIAVDLLLPPRMTPERLAGRGLGTALVMTRSWRSVRLRVPGRDGVTRIGPDRALIEALPARGFAVVVADARGTGASDGTWLAPWSDDEVQDAGEIAEWAAAQSWSNGSVAVVGSSYSGVLALLVGSLGRPCVRAVVAIGVDADAFTDLVAPGGVRNRALVVAASEAVDHLDRDQPPVRLGRLQRLLVAGVRPVDEDVGGRELRRIIRARQTPSIAAALAQVEARDDPYQPTGTPVGQLGIGGRLGALREHLPATQLWASWLDGATADAALRLWSALPGIREVRISATSRSGEQGAGPFDEDTPPDPAPAERFDEIGRFLGRTLFDRGAWGSDGSDGSDGSEMSEGSDSPRGPEAADRPDHSRRRIRYRTMGEGPDWQTTTTWPPPGTVSYELFLARSGRLRWEQGHDVGSMVVPLNRAASSGRLNRWHAALARPIRYGNRRRPDALLASWTGEPLPAPLTITGHPAAALGVRVAAEDVVLIVYLELVAPRGGVRYLTEGILRAQHRARRPDQEPTFLRRDLRPLEPGVRTELRIPMQPTSVRVPAGWRLRLTLAGADRDTFAELAGQPDEITIEFGGPASSRLLLPIVD